MIQAMWPRWRSLCRNRHLWRATKNYNDGTPQCGGPEATVSPSILASPYARFDSGHTVRQVRHRKPQLVKKMASEHGKRLMSFSLIGFAVFAAGLGVQVVLVQVADLPKVSVFVMQLFLSVQVNFLANYHWTWGDRDSPFWRSCWRYNIKRAAGTLLNAGLYPILIHLGMNYLAANTLLVAALTPANYLLGHFWTFAVESGQNLEGMSLEMRDQRSARTAT